MFIFFLNYYAFDEIELIPYFSGESLRLAYQDLDIQQKQNDIKLSKMDNIKKEQAERLGMGMGKTE